MARQKIAVLGATGSVGASSLAVLRLHPDLYRVYVLSAFSQIKKLADLCIEFKPKIAVVPDFNALKELQHLLGSLAFEITILVGEEGLCDSVVEVDTVIAAIVGSVGLASTLAAAKAGKRVLLANKESLVMAGDLLLQTVKKNNAQIIPLDSEHNAIFQCIPHDYENAKNSGVKQVVLTASGGPFWYRQDLSNVTPIEACTHPNWSMGRKISVDSATMMNKGLELIEACYLFNLNLNQIKVVIHPQSVVHSWVEYLDGSIIAQLGNSDMRIPIAQALAYPKRIKSGASNLDLAKMNGMQFLLPDEKRFPCLYLAYKAMNIGNSALIYLNAANEIAVNAFLDGKISFLGIAQIIEQVLFKYPSKNPQSLEQIMQLDQSARRLAYKLVQA